jgi:hypothetical protein
MSESTRDLKEPLLHHVDDDNFKFTTEQLW